MPYNYGRFHPAHFTERSFSGPEPGQKAPGFAAETLDGEHVRLHDLPGKRVVLESGSITCPVFTSNILSMNGLSRAFPDVEFLVLYSREAHPGQKIGPHTSFDEKRTCAQRLREEFPEQRTILIDDTEGTVHRRYGPFPNFVYVLDPDGTVRYRSRWNDPQMVERVLQEDSSSNGKATPPISRNRALLYILRRSGFDAFVDALRDLALKRIGRYPETA